MEGFLIFLFLVLVFALGGVVFYLKQKRFERYFDQDQSEDRGSEEP